MKNELPRKHTKRMFTWTFLLVLIILIIPVRISLNNGALAISPAHAASSVSDVKVTSHSSSSNSGIDGGFNNIRQTGNISPVTLISLLGLTLITTSGTVITILTKKHHNKYD
jgi:hypothetical protein